MKKTVLFLADGTEECEALVVVDLLRRADIEVTTASVMDTQYINSSSGINIKADALATDLDYSDIDMLILPGGMPGTKFLGESEIVCNNVFEFNKQNKNIAAICAAPSVLGKLGLLVGKQAICYPGFEEELKGAQISDKDPVTDKNITTASGLGHAIDFALELIKILKDEAISIEVAKSIGYIK